MNTSTSNTYTIVPGAEYANLNIRMVRGDKESITFIGTELDGTTPFNFGIFDSFESQIRQGSPLSDTVFAELDPSDFVLGQSQVALDYETAEGLPSNSVFDELHCFLQSALLIAAKIKKLYIGVQGTEGLDVTTFGKGKINLTLDGTR